MRLSATLVRLWLATTISGVGCAIGSGPGLLDPGTIPPLDGGPIDERDGTVAFPDARTEDASVPDADATADGVAPGPCVFAGKLVTFDLTTLPAGQADLPPSTKAAGVTATPLTRAGVTAVSTAGAMNASNWPTGAVDTSKHFVFSLSPPSGCKVTITALAIDLKASATGPTMAGVGTSVDNYAALQNIAVTTAGGSTSVPLAGTSGISGAVEIRIAGFNAGTTLGTLRIESTLSVTGSLGP